MSSNSTGKLGGDDGSPDPAGGDHDALRKSQRLRQPNARHDTEYRSPPPANHQSSTSWSQDDHSAVKSMSSLSISAAVFVPRAAAPTAPQQNFVGYNEFEGLQTNRPAILSVSTNESDEIRLLKDSMFQLMSNPASFDDLLKTLTDKFNESVQDEKSLLEIIIIIYELSVEQVNFRYTGARMCDYLSRHMYVKTESGTFRQHLVKRLHQEFLKKDGNIRNLHTIPRLHGFTLFVAELFENFEIGEDNKLERIEVLRKALIDLILTLMNYPDDPNLKCVNNVLKLSGSNLETCEVKESQGTATDMDMIFTKVKQVSVRNDNNVSGWVREMMMKLLTLRATSWGRTLNEEPPSQENLPFQAAAAQEFSNEPIFFAPDGTQISAQEAGFFTGTGNFDEYDQEEEYYGNDYEYDYQQWSNEEEYADGAIVLDDEAYADYEQFLRETNGSYS